jgi:hypothetical protein
MSIHAQLSPEALEALKRQKRNSTISSIVIAALTILLVGLILGFFLLDNYVRETPTIVTYAATMNEDQQLDQRKVTTTITRKPSSPSSAQAKVIAAATASPTAIPVPEVEVITPSASFGDTDDFGFGFGDDAGMGGGFQGIPSTMRKRCTPEDRAERLRESGGIPECEIAVEKALQWLKSTQNSDGSWGNSNKGAMTGFALLAYLGRCETPISIEYGASVLNGIMYLIDLAKKNEGRLAQSGENTNQWVYEHGIATYAMAEAYTFCRQLQISVPELAETTRKAGEMIVKGQGAAGGWLYRYTGGNGGDNSVGFWQIQAIKACQHTMLWELGELDRTLAKSVEWLKSVQGENGAIGYRNQPNRSPGLTGGGVLCIQLVEGPKSSAARKGIEYIEKNSDFKWEDKSANLYYHYYNAQAMINYGGKQWNDYNAKFRDTLLANQSPKGTWTRSHGNHDAVNEHMATCLATMMLEVYYRFLPATGESIRSR